MRAMLLSESIQVAYFIYCIIVDCDGTLTSHYKSFISRTISISPRQIEDSVQVYSRRREIPSLYRSRHTTPLTAFRATGPYIFMQEDSELSV